MRRTWSGDATAEAQAGLGLRDPRGPPETKAGKQALPKKEFTHSFAARCFPFVEEVAQSVFDLVPVGRWALFS